MVGHQNFDFRVKFALEFISSTQTQQKIENIESINICSIYLEPTTTNTFSQLNIEQSVRMVIGPEGGFSDKDLTHLNKVGFQGVKIGPRILRTETAGLASISILQSLYGDL